jgi:hypothetical protein
MSEHEHFTPEPFDDFELGLCAICGYWVVWNEATDTWDLAEDQFAFNFYPADAVPDGWTPLVVLATSIKEDDPTIDEEPTHE